MADGGGRKGTVRCLSPAGCQFASSPAPLPGPPGGVATSNPAPMPIVPRRWLPRLRPRGEGKIVPPGRFLRREEGRATLRPRGTAARGIARAPGGPETESPVRVRHEVADVAVLRPREKADSTCCSASSIQPRRAPRATEGYEAPGTT